MGMLKCLRKKEWFLLHLTIDDLYRGLTQGCLGGEAAVCDCLYYCTMSEGPCTEELWVRLFCPVCVCVCVLSPWWVKRSLWTMSIRQSSFCFTRRPRGTFRMNSVNSLLRRQEENSEGRKRSNWLDGFGWLTASHHEQSSKTQLKKKRFCNTHTGTSQISWLRVGGWENIQRKTTEIFQPSQRNWPRMNSETAR